MNTPKARRPILAACACFALQGSPALARTPPWPTLAPGAYVSGGIGEEDQQDMRVTRDLYNLRLTFAEVGTGAYIAGVTVTIEPAGPGATYGPFADCGPLFHMVLSPGVYRVNATYAGITLTRTVRVGKGATLGTFYWPAQLE
jgi:hypothetical protein